MIGNSGDHPRADFLAVVKRENKVRPAFARQSTVRPGLPFELPPNAE